MSSLDKEEPGKFKTPYDVMLSQLESPQVFPQLLNSRAIDGQFGDGYLRWLAITEQKMRDKPLFFLFGTGLKQFGVEVIKSLIESRGNQSNKIGSDYNFCVTSLEVCQNLILISRYKIKRLNSPINLKKASEMFLQEDYALLATLLDRVHKALPGGRRQTDFAFNSRKNRAPKPRMLRKNKK